MVTGEWRRGCLQSQSAEAWLTNTTSLGSAELAHLLVGEPDEETAGLKMAFKYVCKGAFKEVRFGATMRKMLG